MIYAGILAGGKGERIANGLPKQFITVGGKPILFYSLQVFCEMSSIDMIVLSCNNCYVELAKDICSFLSSPEKVVVIDGGQTRHHSLTNIVTYIKNKGFTNGDKIIFHEAARPLVDSELIHEHIANLNYYEATNTLLGAVDTMIVSKEGRYIDYVPDKQSIYHGQNPQGYDLACLINVLDNVVTEDDIKCERDLCAIYSRIGKIIKIIRGNEKLFKVTYPKDIELLAYYLSIGHK